MKYLILFLLPLSIFTCDDECDDITGGTYLFQIPATLSPVKETYAIGDTLTISSRFSDSVFERITNRTYSLIDYNFYPVARAGRLDSIKLDNSLEFDFLVDPEYNFTPFTFSTGETILDGQYNYKDNEYDLEYKIILKQKGLFQVSFSSTLYFDGDNNENFAGMCPRKLLDTETQLNDGSDNNVDFLLESVLEFIDLVHADPENRFHKFGMYNFYVE